MPDSDNRKRVEQAEYRAKLMEAELNAVKSSKAYRMSKMAGIITIITMIKTGLLIL